MAVEISAFMRRNSGLTLRTPSQLSTARGRVMNRVVVGNCFQGVAKYTEGLQPISILMKVDSTLNTSPAKWSVKRVSTPRENVTVLASAAGIVMPPMFVVKGKTFKPLHSFNTVEAPPNYKWTWQAKAWMEDTRGFEWFREVF